MTLLVLSDSHGRPDLIEEAVRRVRPDGILFAGDGLRDLTRAELPPLAEGCPLWAVSGNCDWLTSPSSLIINGSIFEPQAEELISVEGVRILLMHGHKYDVKSGPTRAIYRAMEAEADVLVYGHTHVPVEYRIPPHDPRMDISLSKPLILFNPGSMGAGSFGTITIRGGTVLCGHGSI